MDKAGETTGASVNVRKKDRDAFSAWCKKHDVIQANMLGRLMRWFMGLDATTRCLVAKHLKEGDEAEVAIIALKRMVDQNQSDQEHHQMADDDFSNGKSDSKRSQQHAPSKKRA